MKFITVHTDGVQRAVCLDAVIYIEKSIDDKALIYLQAGVKSHQLLKSDESFIYIMDILANADLI